MRSVGGRINEVARRRARLVLGRVTAVDRWSVADAPVVRCLTSTADVDDRNVYVQCEVRSRPSLSSLYWHIDNNGTTVAEGPVKEEYWTLVMVGDRVV